MYNLAQYLLDTILFDRPNDNFMSFRTDVGNMAKRHALIYV